MPINRSMLDKYKRDRAIFLETGTYLVDGNVLVGSSIMHMRIRVTSASTTPEN